MSINDFRYLETLNCDGALYLIQTLTSNKKYKVMGISYKERSLLMEDETVHFLGSDLKPWKTGKVLCYHRGKIWSNENHYF